MSRRPGIFQVLRPARDIYGEPNYTHAVLRFLSRAFRAVFPPPPPSAIAQAKRDAELDVLEGPGELSDRARRRRFENAGEIAGLIWIGLMLLFVLGLIDWPF